MAGVQALADPNAMDRCENTHSEREGAGWDEKNLHTQANSQTKERKDRQVNCPDDYVPWCFAGPFARSVAKYIAGRLSIARTSEHYITRGIITAILPVIIVTDTSEETGSKGCEVDAEVVGGR